MFQRIDNIPIQGSPSFQSNNLSSVGDFLCYVHLNEVSILDDQRFMKITPPKSLIYEASMITIGDESCIVVVGDQGIQLWSLNGQTMLFFHPLDDPEIFMRGITAISNSVCVGLSTGGINVFKFSQFEQLSNGHTSMQTLDPAFQNPITALSSSRSMMCAGNENGDISVYEMDNKNDFTVLCTFHGKSSPLTCLCCQKDNNTIFAGFLSGHIRIYRPNIAEMTIEITAHVRSITGIILDPLNKFYATCGEDQFFQVWNIPDFSDENYVRDLKNDVLFFSELIENRLCTGLAFLPDNKIAVASYDDESLVVFQQQI